MQENNIKSDNNNTQEEKIINDSNINANQMEKTNIDRNVVKSVFNEFNLTKKSYFS